VGLLQTQAWPWPKDNGIYLKKVKSLELLASEKEKNVSNKRKVYIKIKKFYEDNFINFM
jgi:hypothetical protein